MPERQWDDSSSGSSSSSHSSSRTSSYSSSSSHRDRDDDDDNGSGTPASPEQLFWWLVVMGVIFLCVMILPAITEARERANEQAKQEAATATTRAITLADVNMIWAVIEPRLADWRRDVRPGTSRFLNAAQAGMRAVPNTRGVVYGYCENERFYVYVLNESSPRSSRGDSDGYVYLPRGNPWNCHPANWRMIDSVSAEVDGWYFVLLDTRTATQVAAQTATP